MAQFTVNNQWITLEDLEAVLNSSSEVILGPQAILAIEKG
jgi:hypothetical protein